MKAFKRFQEVKRDYPDAIALVREGNIYHVFNDDAEILNKVCNRSIAYFSLDPSVNYNCSGFFPNCELEGVFNKLIRSGHRVCFCSCD